AVVCGLRLIVSVAGARPVRALRTTGPAAAFAAKVIRPPPRLRIWTVAVAMIRLHVSRVNTILVELTSSIGRLGNGPTGMNGIPEVEVAKRFCPSVEAIILEFTASGNRNPSKGVRLDDRITCRTLVTAGVAGVIIVGVVGVVCGLLGFSGLIGGCVVKV